MNFCNKDNIKYMLLISISIIVLGVLYCIVTSNLKEGLDKTVGLVDFTHSDPNIKPEPLPDFCIGNGNFVSHPNSTVPLVATAGYLHSNIGACENECTPERGCFAVSFDRASKDVMKKCNIYSGASSTGGDTIKAGTVCSRVSPRCSVSGYKLDNTSSELATVIKPSNGGYFTHTSEGACAVECNNRPDCIGYLYDNSSKKHWKPCRVFSKNRPGASTGFPVAGICSRNKVSSTVSSSTVSGLAGNWHQVGAPTSKIITIKDAGEINGKQKITGTGNGMPFGGGWGFLNTPNSMFFEFGNKTTLPALLANKNSSGQFTKIEFNNGAVWNRVTSSSTSSPSPPPSSDGPPAPPPSTGICAVSLPGLVATYGPAWPMWNSAWTADCAKQTTSEGCAFWAAGGGAAKLPLCTWTPATISSTPTHPLAPPTKSPSSQTHDSVSPPSSPQSSQSNTQEKPNTIIPVIPPDHPRQKKINEILNPIISRGLYQSPLPVAQ